MSGSVLGAKSRHTLRHGLAPTQKLPPYHSYAGTTWLLGIVIFAVVAFTFATVRYRMNCDPQFES